MATLSEVQVIVHGLVVAATGLGACVLLLAAPHRNWNRWLAFYLFLVCGNFATDLAIGLASAQRDAGLLAPASFAAQAALLRSLGFALLILDPAVLVYFVSIFPRRTRVAEGWAGAAALGAVVVVFLAIEVAGRQLSPPTQGASPWRLAFFMFLGGCYAYASLRMLASLLHERSTIMAQQVRIITLGVLAVSLPRLALLVDDLRPQGSDHGALPWFLAARLVLLWALFGVVVLVLRRPAAVAAAGPARTLRSLAMVFAVFTALWLVAPALRVLYGPEPVLTVPTLNAAGVASEVLTFPFRWFVFTGAMLYGIVHYELLSVDRRGLAMGLVVAVGAAGLLVVTATAALLGPWAADIASAAVFATGLGFFMVLGRGASTGADHQRKVEVYRAALAAALAEGPLEGSRLDELTRTRRRLRVSAREHEILLAVAQAEEGRPPGEVVLGRYELLGRLGAGGYATVHLARDREDGRLVVVKHVRADLAGSKALASALRELEVARRVSHPHVIALHDVVRVADGAVIVAEFAEGGSLRERLHAEGRLPPQRAVQVLRDVLRGLEAVHEAGVVHGDLKPENVLFDAPGAAKLADFGVSRAPAAQRTLVDEGTKHALAGTLAYMAPEQVRGAPPSARSDLYAVGAMAWEILTGSPLVDPTGVPLYEVMARIAEGSLPPLHLVPEAWRPFLRGCLASAPSERFATAAEAARSLPGSGPSAGASRLPGVTTRWRRS